jgi:putative membrane-bound dehydrogenase-like protein
MAKWSLVLYALLLPLLGAPSGVTAGDDRHQIPDTERSATRPMSAQEAAAGFRGPDGFRVGVFAAEPDVRNPVAMAWDPRGRLWVAENFTYSDSTDRFDLRLRDRVLIFEDADGDGRFDRRTVFTDEVQRLGSIELGLGGVWLLCPPQLLFVPDRNRDDLPDGPAEVVLDGFAVATENHHTFANGLRWGPDGWLYGRCGASSPGQVGAPGTPEAQRIPLRGGLWRYDTLRKRFEVLAHGTTNPWGHDWNSLGEAFFINTVNGHLWHMIPGAHFMRPHTIEPNPRAYALIDQHADHYHWENKEMKYPYRPSGEDDRLGGGHAHSGLMIYQANQWPEACRGKLFTLNFHGRRVNVDRLERAGSGYVGRHQPDFLFSPDPWFRGIDLSQGPDGSAFILDWSDTGECHEHDGVHRSSGRIYKVAWGQPALSTVPDVSRLDQAELAGLHRHPNEWYVRQARRVLVERAGRGDLLVEARLMLHRLLSEGSVPAQRLRALWTLFAIGDPDAEFYTRLLGDPHESVRAWSIRFLTDGLPIDTIFSERGGADVALSSDLLGRLTALASSDPSGLVRLVLASTLQRLPVHQRGGLAQALAARGEDASDHNIPALIWTGLIPVANAEPSTLVKVATASRMPALVRWISRRLGEDIESAPEPLNRLLEELIQKPSEFRLEAVTGLTEALAGWRKAPSPVAWERFKLSLSRTDDSMVGDRLRDLDVLFGSGRALAEVTRLAIDEKASLEARKSALKTLVASRPHDLRVICEKLLRVRFLNTIAVQGLVLFDEPSIGRAIASNYRSFHPSERSAAVAALVTRSAFASALLDEIEAGRISRQELSAFDARQIRALGDAALTERLSRVWGEAREASVDRRARIDALKRRLDPAALASADRGRGRALFDRICGSCHRLHGHGGEIGPDLTGAGRENLDYLLENLIDPSASVSADFRMVVVALADGRVQSGLIRAQSERTLTLQTQTETLMLDRREIEGVKPTRQSLMPEGLLDPLSPAEVLDLISYLRGRTQVPLPTSGR